ncbi:MAG: thioredoxin family protein [Muribaculaceae bacterium]|nr:thioredoxin family protein [Muribaculaceae bacterium]
MKKNILLLLAFFLTVLTSFSQIIDPVSWSWSARMTDSAHGVVTLKAKIDEGFHIYGFTEHPDGPVPTEIVFDDVDGVIYDGSIISSPAPQREIDSTFNLELEMWGHEVTFSRTFTVTNGSVPSAITGSVRFMACNDRTCMAPKTEHFTANVTTSNVTSQTVVVEEPVVDTVPETPVINESIPQLVEDTDFDIYAPVTSAELSAVNNAWWYLLVMGFLGGLLALLTPCVWPMIPMTVSFFLKKTKSRSRSIVDAVVYGLSIVVIYLGMGLAITLIFDAGTLNELATSAVFNLIFFALLVVFAISFFGAFDIKLPSRWSNKMDNMAEKTSGYLSIFFMAFTLVLVSFSCTGPIIGTLLVEAASNGTITGPALGMGGFAIGLALPFALFAFFPSLLKEMPKSGGWMNSVKVVLGFIELILSLKFLSVADLAYGWRILDREVFLAIWIVLFVLMGMYLLGKLRFPHDAPKQHTGVGAFFLATISFSFAVYLLPGMWGAPLKAISAFAPPLNTQDFNLYEAEVREFTDYDEGMKYARDNDMPVMVDFSGFGCVNCRKMEGAVFDTEIVRELLDKEYVFIKLMVDDKADLAKPYTVEENGKPLTITTTGEKWSYLQRHKFNTNSQPYYVLLTGQGQMLAPARQYDENVEAFVEWLHEGLEAFSRVENN